MTVCSFGRYVKLVGLALLIEKKAYVTAVNDNRTGQVFIIEFGTLKAVIY